MIDYQTRIFHPFRGQPLALAKNDNRISIQQRPSVDWDFTDCYLILMVWNCLLVLLGAVHVAILASGTLVAIVYLFFDISGHHLYLYPEKSVQIDSKFTHSIEPTI